MRRLLYILTVTILVEGCNEKPSKQTVNIFNSTEIENNDSTTFMYNVFKKDNVSIDVKNDNFKYNIILTINNSKQEYDLEKLNIPTKTPDEIMWANKDYACMMTWWSQSLSRHIFIPMNQTNKFIYVDKDIEETDSINNNIVYIDTVLFDKNRVVFKIENLLTRKTKEITLKVNERNSIYPYYKDIKLTKNKLTIKTPLELINIDIKEINNGR